MAWKVFWFFPAALLSLWTWELLIFNPYLGIFAAVSALILYLSLSYPIRLLTGLTFISILLLTLSQIFYTPKDYLFNFTPAEKSLARVRTGEYPPSTHFITRRWEERRESIIISKIVRNFSEIIDPNLYFFASHPRERIGVGEAEKFSYLFIPLFIYGLTIIRKLPGKRRLFLILIPMVSTVLMGDIKTLGPFAFYPFFLSVIALSFNNLGERLKDVLA